MVDNPFGFRKNWQILRTETDRVGKEVEAWPYNRLNQDAEERQPIERRIDEHVVTFQVNCYKTLPNGDLGICIDAHGGPATLLGLKPSYRFFKRADHSVYY